MILLRQLLMLSVYIPFGMYTWIGDSIFITACSEELIKNSYWWYYNKSIMSWHVVFWIIEFIYRWPSIVGVIPFFIHCIIWLITYIFWEYNKLLAICIWTIIHLLYNFYLT